MPRSPNESSPPRGFQFRIGTLLIVIAWLALACAGLAMPAAFWAGVLLTVTLSALLLSPLLIIYRGGGVRAFAIGFLIFGAGYLACVMALDRSLQAWNTGVMPTTRLAFKAYLRTHGQKRRPVAVTQGSFSPATGSAATPAPAPTVVQLPRYFAEDFVELTHSILAMLLGLLGGILAQLLYLTRPDDSRYDSTATISRQGAEAQSSR